MVDKTENYSPSKVMSLVVISIVVLRLRGKLALLAGFAVIMLRGGMLN